MVNKCFCNMSGATNLSCVIKGTMSMLTFKCSLSFWISYYINNCLLLNAKVISWIFNIWHKINGQILNFQYLAMRFKSWILNIWHARSNLKFSTFGMAGQILNFQHLAEQVKSWIFNIWHGRSNLEFSIFGMAGQSWIYSIGILGQILNFLIFGILGQMLNIKYLAPKSHIDKFFSIVCFYLRSITILRISFELP